MTQFQVVLYSLLLVLLLLLSAFFSLAETALMAVNRYRLRHRGRLKKRYAVLLLRLLKRPDRLLGTILIGSTVAVMFASSLATLIAFHFWGDQGALFATLLLTIIVLIFAEITPKTFAVLFPDKIVQWVAYPVYIFLKILYPLVWFANSITSGIFHLLHIRIANRIIEPLSREELRSVVYDTSGKISRQYQNMLLGILDLNKLTVDDVMISRHEIIGINLEQDWDKILVEIDKFSQGEFLPVYRDNINQLIGILYIRDILRSLLTQNTLSREILQQLLQKPYFVPQGTSLYTQLSYFQQSHDKVAFVVDEYGEIQGMLTLNDILEEIVGDFTSTLALGKRIQKQTDSSYLVDGGMTVREFNRLTEWELPVGGPRTINGLIVEHLESLPRAGIAILIANYPIEIMQVKDNRVKTAKIFPRLMRAIPNE